MLNYPQPFNSTPIRELALISDDMTYRISYPSKRHYTTLPKLGKQMNAGKVVSIPGSLVFDKTIDARRSSDALKFQFVNKTAEDGEIDSKALSSVNSGAVFQKERLKAGSKNAYKVNEIHYWYKTKFPGESLDSKLRRAQLVEKFEKRLKEGTK